MSDIVVACGAMNFGPDTLTYKSLGGSETAALMAGKVLAKRGHNVLMFCNLPPQGHPDFFPGGKASDGVTYAPLAAFPEYVGITEHDLLIAVRDPSLVAQHAQARKKVLWCHDICTKKGMQRAFDAMGWTFDEVWAVSEWHRQQIAETTGYPLSHIVAMRNGIVPVDVMPVVRAEKQLLYASRPERGLDNLIKPGGIMDNLPEYKLLVAMYDHFPEHMQPYYAQIFARMKAMTNVEFIGPKTQAELRAIIAESTAYIYPTQFEETSCILARECIEQGTPFLTTRTGALPETLGGCGTFFDDWRQGEMQQLIGSEGWCKKFAAFTRERLENPLWTAHADMLGRTDLYWDGVAEMMEARIATPQPKLFSHIWSLIQDGDIIPARALMQANLPDDVISPPVARLFDELVTQYSFVEADMKEYYERTYTERLASPENRLVFETNYDTPRLQAIAAEIAKLPAGSCVLDYGCGAGHVVAALAKRFPHINFMGYDYSQSGVDVIKQGALDNSFLNLTATTQSQSACYDAVICSEVLEHTKKPWETLTEVEALVRPGGRVIITVPFGAWEPKTYERKGHWSQREHLWSIDRVMLREMTGDKPNRSLVGLVAGMDAYGRPIGNAVLAYDADHKPIPAVDVLAKAMRHCPRMTCAAAIIAYNNEDTILRMLNSLDGQVQFVNVALGPCTDQTKTLIGSWFMQRPWIRHRIIDVPKIEPYKYGFDHARNASMEDLSDDFDWVLWIDTDEYLSGPIKKYLRNSAMQGYLIAQHHFTCVPRGNPPEIDRPARLFRTDQNYVAKGHIHEHFEVPEGGPGRCFMLPDVDIGHTGYVNEDVRRERFKRNLPYLEWDHVDDAGRKLHPFLWLRDRIHLMRFEQDPLKRVALAEEAEKYYNLNQEQMGSFGPGLAMSLQYLAEVYQVLGKGVPLAVKFSLDDRGTELQGRFSDYEQFERVMGQLLKPEFKDRSSRYYG